MQICRKGSYSSILRLECNTQLFHMFLGSINLQLLLCLREKEFIDYNEIARSCSWI